MRYPAVLRWGGSPDPRRAPSPGLSTIFLLFAASAVSASAQPNRDLDFLADHTDFANIRKMLPEYSRRLAVEQLEARRRKAETWSADDMQKRREQVRASIRRAVGGLPERTPLNARITGVIDRGDYRIEKIVFESQPRFFVTANLYVPQKGQGPFPAILYPLGHEQGAKSHTAWQHMLVTFALRGYVALAWDTIGQGERLQLFDEDLRASKAGGSTTEHTVLGAQALLVGDAMARYTIWDGIRALDYLLSRSEVDPKRVGVTGNSGGGTHTAYLAALEDRLAVAAPSCYITSWRRLLETLGPQDAEQCLPGWLADGMDHADFVEAFAPRPYLMLTAIRDFFSITGARETFSEVKRGWTDPQRIAMVEVDDGHGYNKERRIAAYRWFDHWLKDAKAPDGEPEIQIATEDELFCTKTGQVNTDLASETVFTLNRERAKSLRRTGVVELDDVRRLTGFEKKDTSLRERPFGSVERARYHINRLTFESEPGIVIPALEYAPASEAKRAAIVMVHGRGKAAGDTDASSFAASGFTVFSIDARGFGETRNIDTDRTWARNFGDYESAETAILIRRTLIGMRALDVIRAVDVLAARPNVDPQRIYAVGYGAGATTVLHAAALDSRIRQIALERMLVSYQAVVESRMNQGIFEEIIPGVLKSYDLPDLVAKVAPRKVWISDAEDPMHALVPVDAVKALYGGGRVQVMRRAPQATAPSIYRFEESR
jgi:cephalosporin-C deacetylase-like acetyl esterase